MPSPIICYEGPVWRPFYKMYLLQCWSKRETIFGENVAAHLFYTQLSKAGLQELEVVNPFKLLSLKNNPLWGQLDSEYWRQNLGDVHIQER